MLPSAVVFPILLLNDKEVLCGPRGSQFLNKPWNNVVNWTITIALFVMSGLLAAQVLLPRLLPLEPGLRSLTAMRSTGLSNDE